jgi:16S rRNA (adenine1518-N6/adenine1519-N6)-dimethyltransferase
LRALGLKPRRGLSQSFLEDARVAATIVRTAHIDPTIDVLEVGPGLGVLTERLVQHARRVVAVELDAELAASLRSSLAANNLTVCTADVLTVDPAAFFDEPFVVVANLPYHITSPALRHLLGGGPPYAARLVVMVQREVAERIAAKPGDLSGLAVAIQAQASVRLVRTVPNTAFYPRPKVDSAVLELTPLPAPPISRGEVPDFVRLVQAGFKQPRKQLANSLAEGLGVDKPHAVALLQAAAIDPSRRPQELTVDDWVRLFRCEPGG